MIEHRGPVLRPGIGTLPVQRGRIVNREEDVQQIPEPYLLGIERDLDNLDVTRGTRADGFVAWVLHVPAGVPGLGLIHAAELLEDRLETPEAAAREGGDFALICHVVGCL